MSKCLYIFGDLSKMILPLYFYIAVWDIYYVYLFFQDIEDNLNRIVDFLEDDFNRIVDFFSNFYSKFYKCFVYLFGQFAVEAIKLIK